MLHVPLLCSPHITCSVLAASSLTTVSPSSIASASSLSALAMRRNSRRATPAQVASPGRIHALHAPAPTCCHPSSILTPHASRPQSPSPLAFPPERHAPRVPKRPPVGIDRETRCLRHSRDV